MNSSYNSIAVRVVVVCVPTWWDPELGTWITLTYLLVLTNGILDVPLKREHFLKWTPAQIWAPEN